MPGGDTTVAVIGGGAAGIAAARRLHDARVECLLIEARARLGGRAWTVQAGGHPVDLGCGWLHSADRNEWTQIAEAQGRTLDRTRPPWQRAQAARDLTPEERRAFQNAMAAFFERVSATAAEARDIAAGDLLEPGGRWNGLINSIVSFISGGDAERVSVRDFENYADTEANWRVVEGYGAVIAAYGAGLPMLLDCPVTRIDHSGRRLRIETPRGVLAAEKAIVTLPSTILAENESLFAPVLPDKTRAAAGVPLGLVDKLYLTLDRAQEFDRDTRLFGRTDRSTGSYTLNAYGLSQIECYYGAGLAAELESGGERAFFDRAVADLCSHFGADFSKRVRLLALHRWGTDVFARGSYSFALPGHAEDRQVLAAPVDGRLFFAGEACSKHDFSTAHGAYRTGIAAAEAALAALRARG
jgi:monoamine oxidase